MRGVCVVSASGFRAREQASTRWGIAPRMKAVTPVRLAHAPRKAGPVVVLGSRTAIGGGGFSACTSWQRAMWKSSLPTGHRDARRRDVYRGPRRGIRCARHVCRRSFYDDHERRRRHPHVQRYRRTRCCTRISLVTKTTSLPSELIKNNFRRSWGLDVEGTRLRSRLTE